MKYILFLHHFNTSAIFFVLISILFSNTPVSALEIKKIILSGNSIDIGFEKLLHKKVGEFSQREIKSLGVKIINEYHIRGYTTCYVEKLIMKKNGILEIQIRESRILGLKVLGIGKNEATKIGEMIVPIIGDIYNKFILQKRIKMAKKRHNLNTVRVYPVKYRNSGDVFLSIKVSKMSRGNLYGKISTEQIYGISPEIGFYYPFKESALDQSLKIGYRDGDFRKIKGDIRYYIFHDKKVLGLYFGLNSSRLIEQWERYDSEYQSISLTPFLGLKIIYENTIFELYLEEIASEICQYYEDKYIDYDTRLTFELNISNKSLILAKKKSTDFKLSLAGGRSRINKKGYLITSLYLKTAISPFIYMKLIPELNIYYTSSTERYLWDYVYDKNLIGFFNNFTASKWKNSIGIDIEIEVSPQFFSVGPFINSGYFQDEIKKWETSTGGGLKGKINYRKLLIEVIFAWDLSVGPDEGGLYLSAENKF